jgi:hypothetical protein
MLVVESKLDNELLVYLYFLENRWHVQGHSSVTRGGVTTSRIRPAILIADWWNFKSGTAIVDSAIIELVFT